jgi:heme exporter protein B
MNLALLALIARDLRRAWIGGGALLPVAFFLLVAILFPFAIGPDAKLLARVGGGVLWAAALLAALIPIERLVAPDLASGVIDQLLVRGQSATTIAFAKLIAHWLAFAPPILVAALPAAAAAAAPRGQTGIASALTNTTKTIGGSFASAIFAIILFLGAGQAVSATASSLGSYLTVFAVCGIGALVAAVLLFLVPKLAFADTEAYDELLPEAEHEKL